MVQQAGVKGWRRQIRRARVVETRDGVANVSYTRSQRADVPEARKSRGCRGQVPKARSAAAEVAEARGGAGASVEEARRRAGGRVPEARGRRNLDERDADAPHHAGEVAVDRGGWSAHGDRHRGKGERGLRELDRAVVNNEGNNGCEGQTHARNRHHASGHDHHLMYRHAE